jgi:hypothetical protein
MKDILLKILSGRYILTVIGGVVFAKIAWNQQLPPEAVASILTAIVMSYFSKDRGAHK